VALSIFPASAIAETPLLAGIAHVAIRVSDLTKSLDFLQNGIIGKLPAHDPPAASPAIQYPDPRSQEQM
jgi:hypothetical protein